MDKIKVTTKQIAILLTYIISAPVMAGFVFMTLWNWFIPHVLELPTIGIIESIGMILLIRGSSMRYSDKHGMDNDVFIDYVSRAMRSLFVGSAFILVLGWLLHNML